MKKKTIALLLGMAMLFAAFAPGVFAEEVNPTPTPTAETPGEQKTVESTETPANQTTTPPETTETAEPTVAPTDTPSGDATATPTTQPTTEPTATPVVAPTETPVVCTCGAVPGEDGKTIHAEDCPLYTAPEKPVEVKHIEGCTDDCTGEDCKCPCHLFDKLMACKTLEELFALIHETSEEELAALSEEQVAAIEVKIAALEPEPLPAVVIEESTDEPVISEIVYPTVNFDDVAPFGAPVVGGEG